MGVCVIDNQNIINCINIGDIDGKDRGGGIIGEVGGVNWDSIKELNIKNCYNVGSVNSIGNYAGGIVGCQGTICKENSLNIENVYNIGKLNGKNTGGILAKIDYSASTTTITKINNAYYTDAIGVETGKTFEGKITQKAEDEIKSQDFVDILNNNRQNNSEWREWILGADGYPTLK